MGRGYRTVQADGQAMFEAQSPERRREIFRSADRFATAFDWARRYLPDEDPALAASAALVLKSQTGKTTRGAVLARLRQQGRDSASRNGGSNGIPNESEAP